MRYLFGGVLLGMLVWVGSLVNQFYENKEHLAQLRAQSAVQKQQLEWYHQQITLTDEVMEGRAYYKEVQDEMWHKAIEQLYAAKEPYHMAEMDIDAPVPHALARSLLVQYQAITAHSADGQGNAACLARQGTSHTTAGKGANRTQSCPLE